jgi:hypothetical protein
MTTNQLTLFIPHDGAFAQIADIVARLRKPQWLSHYRSFARQHLGLGRITATTLTNVTELTMVSGFTVPVDTSDDVVIIGEANVTNTDYLAWNGVVHVLDKVLLPPWIGQSIMATLRTYPELGNLMLLLDRFGLDTTLDDISSDDATFTIFAVSHASFD